MQVPASVCDRPHDATPGHPGSWQRVAVLLLTMFFLEASVAADSVKGQLERGIVGLEWGMPAEDILKVYPNAKKNTGARPSLFIRQPAGVMGIRTLKDGVSLVSEGDKLNAVTFIVDGANALAFVRMLNEAFGKPRALVEKSAFGTYTHFYEWSTSRFGASIFYSTKEGKEDSMPQGSISARMQSGPITQSLIDAARQLSKPPK